MFSVDLKSLGGGQVAPPFEFAMKKTPVFHSVLAAALPPRRAASRAEGQASW